MTVYLIFTTCTRNGFKKLQCEQTLYTMRNWFSFEKRQVFKCWNFSERNNRIDNIDNSKSLIKRLFNLDAVFLNSDTGGVLKQKVFLEISQNSQENNCARFSLLIKLQVSFFIKL